MAGGRPFKLIDLIVVLVLGALLIPPMLPGIQRVKDYAWIAMCSSNLKQIGAAMAQYAEDNHGAFPRTRWDPESEQVNFFTNPTATNPFASDGPLPNDVTAGFYLLARSYGLEPQAFYCPLAELGPASQTTPLGWRTASNFVGPQSLTYGMTNPFPSKAASAGGFRWSSDLGADFPLAGDMNPGQAALAITQSSSVDQVRAANTRNHWNRNGQNLLYADGHVDFSSTPFAGVGGDNIYTYGPSSANSGGIGVIGLPTSAEDAVLLPVATIDPQALTDPSTIDRRWDLFWTTLRYSLLGAVCIMLSVRFKLLRHPRMWGYRGRSS